MTLRASAPGEYGGLRLVSAAIVFGDSEVELEDLAAGDVVISAWAEILEAFDAGTTNVLTLGDGTTDDKFLAGGDVDETSLGASAAKGPFEAEAAAGALTATYAQTGTAATAGAARIYALVTSSPA